MANNTAGSEEWRTWIVQKNTFYRNVQLIHIAESIPGIVFSCLILHIVSRAEGRFRLFGILAVGDLMTNLSELFDSTLKIALMIQIPGKPDLSNMKFSPMLCMIFPHCHMAIWQQMWSTYATFAISLERAIAVFAPMWYAAMWKKGAEKNYHRVWIAIILGSCMVGYLPPLLRDPATANSKMKCNPMDTVGGFFIGWMSFCRMTIGMLSAVVTFFAVLKGKSVLSEHGGLDKEIEARLNRTATAVVITTTILDIFPSFLIYLVQNQLLSFAIPKKEINQYFGAFYCIRVFNTVVNLPLYIIINKDFRNLTKEVIFGKSGNNRGSTKTVTTTQAKQS